MRFETLVLNVLTISATCSAVLLPLLLLAPRIQKRVAARSFHALFLLLALRLLVPVRLTLPEPVVTVEAPAYTVTMPAGAAAMPGPGPSAPGPVVGNAAAPVAGKTEKEIPLTDILGTVWLAGIGVCLLWGAGSYALARRKLLRDARAADGAEEALLRGLAAQLGLRRPPKLVHAPGASGPLMLGLLRPVIVLPERPCGPEALGFILRHELTHLRRGDVACKSVLSLACAVHWFNPLVWLMSRAAGRNLELCCDDAVVRGLSQAERRRYGSVLLDAAEGTRALALSTSFGSGKRQLKARLTNLFAEKRASAVLVCLVLGTALLLGGLVACESKEEAGNPANTARRAQYAAWFGENFQADSTSVVLADLTGDGLDELIVLANRDGGNGEPMSMREGLTADDFFYADILVYGVVEDEVTQFYNGSVSSSHAGWGYYYLCTMTNNAPRLLLFNPYNNQGFADYSYELFHFDETGAQVRDDAGNVFFSLEPENVMGPEVSGDSTPAEVEDFLTRVEGYRAGAIPLLTYDAGYESPVGVSVDFRYWYADPEQAFAGGKEGTVIGEDAQFNYPVPAAPATPEAAIDLLEATLQEYQDGYVFRVPTYYEGEWNILIYGRMRMEGDNYQSVHYLEGTDWARGMRYSFETNGAYFSELAMDVSVTAPDGAAAVRTITLLEKDYAPGAFWAETLFRQREHLAFLTCLYDAPEEIDPNAVFYSGVGTEWRESDLAEEERLALLDAGWGEGAFQLDVFRITTAEADAFLMEKAGVTLEQLHIPFEWLYLEEFDAYYQSVSDTNLPLITVIGSVRDSTSIDVIYEDQNGNGYCVGLDTTGESYRFQSHVKIEPYPPVMAD